VQAVIQGGQRLNARAAAQDGSFGVARSEPSRWQGFIGEANRRGGFVRTLLGHFRHEVGHYFFDRLVKDGPHIEEFRGLFGDERADYAAALSRHYAGPPSPDFHDAYISSYARAHPAEDWAETFAHYLHVLDTLETGQHFGFAQGIPARMSLPGVPDLELLLAEWTELTIALNALNRSMGVPDAYPFAISPTVRKKLELVHRIVRERRAPASRAA
jgi:hypothetical protein